LRIVSACSDGRIDDPGTFEGSRAQGFAIDRLPLAGAIVSPTLAEAVSSGKPMEALSVLRADTEKKEALFAEFDKIYGARLKEKLALSDAIAIALKELVSPGENAQSALVEQLKKSAKDRNKKNIPLETLEAKMTSMPQGAPLIELELQSHSDINELQNDHEHHGCGAWCSNTKNALESTAVTALMLEEYIAERFPQAKERIRVVRVHHLTGTDEKIVDTKSLDGQKKIDPALQRELEKHDFSPREYKDADKGIVRSDSKPYNRNDRTEHSEPVVMISNTPSAFAMPYVSKLEQTMLADPAATYKFLKVLVHIASVKHIAREKEAHAQGKRTEKQPLLIHFDFPADDPQTLALYEQLYQQFQEELQNSESDLREQLKKDGVETDEVVVVRTKTHAARLVDPENISLKTEFIS